MVTEIHPRLLNLLLNEAGIPGLVRGIRLEEWEPKPKQFAAWEQAVSWVANLRDHYVTSYRDMADYPEDRSRMGKGLLFIGPPGTGKTTLAALVVQEVFFRYNYLPVHFTAYADVIAEKVEMVRLDSQVKSGEPAAVDRYWQLTTRERVLRDIPVLGLDDLGKERRTGSGFAEDEFDRLLRQRYRDIRPTIVTTNIRAKDWGQIYGPSMESFMNQAFYKVSMAGEDLRG